MDITLHINLAHEKFIRCIGYNLHPPFSQNIGKTNMRKIRMDEGKNCAVHFTGANGKYTGSATHQTAGGKDSVMISFYRKINITNLKTLSETISYLQTSKPYPLKSYLKDEENKYMYGLLLPYDDIDETNGRTDTTLAETDLTGSGLGNVRGLYNGNDPDVIIGSHWDLLPDINVGSDPLEQYILFRERLLGTLMYSADLKEYIFNSRNQFLPEVLIRNEEDIKKTIAWRIRFIDLGHSISTGTIRIFIPLEWAD